MDTFDVIPKHNSLGGDYQAGIDTILDCQVVCREEETCVGIDWEFPKDDCYLFYDRDQLDANAENDDVDQYIRVPSCSNGK